MKEQIYRATKTNTSNNNTSKFTPLAIAVVLQAIKDYYQKKEIKDKKSGEVKTTYPMRDEVKNWINTESVYLDFLGIERSFLIRLLENTDETQVLAKIKTFEMA